MNTDLRNEVLESMTEQIEDLCHIHDHITRIILNLKFEDHWFSGYDEPERRKFDLAPMIRLMIYKHAREVSQSELHRRLRGVAYLGVRFGFDSPPQQQIISFNKRERFSPEERLILKRISDILVDLCDEHGIMRKKEPKVEADKLDNEQVDEHEILDAVQRATDLGLKEFSADRADNVTHPLEAFFERQGYLNMSKAGTTTKSRRFARLSDRDNVPHSSTHNSTMKKIADPESQLTLDDFNEGSGMPEWKRIRDEVLEPFHTGVEAILEELTEGDDVDSAFSEPVHAAIDITPWPFYASPYWSRSTAAEKDKDPIRVEIDGETRLIDPDYPELVSGTKNSGERAYLIATISIIAEDTPIILGVEPVRDKRNWEKAINADVENPSRADTVDRLIEQASQHVDLNKVFLDRGFDSDEVRDVIDRHDDLYVLGKSARSEVDENHIEEIKDDDFYDSRLYHGTHEYDGAEHDITYVYKPSDRNEEKYVIFTFNEHVDHERAEGLLSQYDQRMEIENQYKTIKKHFLPTCASKDFRIRFLYFVIGTMLYNVWRLANYNLRDAVDFDLGESPPIPAGELIELVGLCLFEPPD